MTTLSGPWLAALALFAAASAFTPGPNNAMLLASGLNYGFRRTLPHIAGVGFGHAAVIALFAAGLGVLFTRYPIAYTVLKYAGAAYLIWLAWLIARAGAPRGNDRGRPMTFFGAVLFQWVNVKGLFVAASGVTAYAAIAAWPWNIVVLTGVFLATGLSSAATWALFGTGLRRFLDQPRALRLFNFGMALALLASLVPVLFGD